MLAKTLAVKIKAIRVFCLVHLLFLFLKEELRQRSVIIIVINKHQTSIVFSVM